ncbi:MAG: YcxB family protein [Planctomycetota bacterium]|nr:YcxB family protein [Planctomycetota bacterium]
MAEESIVARYRWTVAELQEALRWHARQPRKHQRIYLWLWLFLVFVLVGFVAILEQSGRPVLAELVGHLSKFALPVMVILAIYVVVFRWIIPAVVRRRFAERPDKDEEVEFTITPDGMTVVNATSRTEWSWKGLHKVVCTPKGILVYPQPLLFNWLPRSAFAPGDYGRAAMIMRAHAPQFVALTGAPTRCFACGHDLQGISGGGNCPECGATREAEAK